MRPWNARGIVKRFRVSREPTPKPFDRKGCLAAGHKPGSVHASPLAGWALTAFSYDPCGSCPPHGGPRPTCLTGEQPYRGGLDLLRGPMAVSSSPSATSGLCAHPPARGRSRFCSSVGALAPVARRPWDRRTTPLAHGAGTFLTSRVSRVASAIRRLPGGAPSSGCPDEASPREGRGSGPPSDRLEPF